MKKIVLLLGGNKLNQGILNKFQRKGYLVYVVDWNEMPQLIGDKHYRLDVKEPTAIINALKYDGVWDNVCFAYSSIDLAVKAVATINREIGLDTIPEDGLKNAASKSMMTSRNSTTRAQNKYKRVTNFNFCVFCLASGYMFSSSSVCSKTE